MSLPETRAKIWETFDKVYGNTHALGAVVHNAGQYVGVTSTNAAGIQATGPPPGFGDGSLIKEGSVDFTQMHYYQRMYGDAFVDLCEQGLARFKGDAGGSLVGISSPGCTLQYKANLGYDMPGSGKCVMEYATVWESTSASGAHLTAMTRPCWHGRAVRNRHRHAIEQANAP